MTTIKPTGPSGLLLRCGSETFEAIRIAHDEPTILFEECTSQRHTRASLLDVGDLLTHAGATVVRPEGPPGRFGLLPSCLPWPTKPSEAWRSATQRRLAYVEVTKTNAFFDVQCGAGVSEVAQRLEDRSPPSLEELKALLRAYFVIEAIYCTPWVKAVVDAGLYEG